MDTFNIPEMLAGELLYSFMVRFAEANLLTIDGLARYCVMNMDQSRTPGRKMRMPIGSAVYIPRFAAVTGIDPLVLFLEHTVYPGTAPLQLPGKQTRVINCAFREGGWRYPNLIGKPQPDMSGLMFCPVCREEDIQKNGFAWLHREHHMPGVTACCRHGVKLVPLYHEVVQKGAHLLFPDVKPESADDLEISFAEFSSDFLNRSMDMNRIQVRKLILEKLGTASCKMDPCMQRLLKDDIASYCSDLRKGRRQIDEGKLLAGLFAAYRFVSNIPVISDDDMHDRFIACSQGYELIGNYSGTIIHMRKDGGKKFVTTPFGFVSGWRSPEEDPENEQDKFVQVVRCSRNGEYEPIGEMISSVKKMPFCHTVCGTVFEAKPKDIIENGANCPCMEKSAANLNFASGKVNGDYELLSVSGDRVLTIKALKCGHIFDIGYASWAKNPGCRVCGMERYKETLFKYKCSAGSDVYDPALSFKQAVAELVGDEYEVTGKYINACSPISIYHCVCGHSKEYLPVDFLHGARCGCFTDIPHGDEFREYVRIVSCGLYEITEMDRSKRYLVRNTVTGEVKAMDKAYIVQELKRPTSSPILPLEKKGVYGDPFSIRIGKVMDALSNDIGTGHIFDMPALKQTGLSGRKLIPVIRQLCKDGIVEKVKGTQTYRFTGGM